MLAKRIIPCLDVKDGRTVKGTNFVGLRDAGDPVELAARYCDEGADELTLLDISATDEGRRTLARLVRDVAGAINVPFTVGGGIGSVEDIGRLLEAGADKVSINTAAFRSPELITAAAGSFGSQCIVVSIDAKLRESSEWAVYLNGGRQATDTAAVAWAIRAAGLGAGEILLTSIASDGMQHGFDIELTRQVSLSVGVPVVASGGAGSCADFVSVFTEGKADAALAASIFHYDQLGIPELKSFLKVRGIEVRT
ncbi:MAG: imidazole glycerol phosphate synthase subunit HisF [Pyrinomonadaceae bacterium]